MFEKLNGGDKQMAEHLTLMVDAMDNESLKKVHTEFFKDVSLTEFEEKISKLDDDKKHSFINACLFLEESASIGTQIPAVKYLLLFTSIETLMGEKYKPFEQWLITSKNVNGNAEKEDMLLNMKIENREEFSKTIKELSKIYHKYYGVTEGVRKFFNDYIDLDDKKKIIRSLLVEDKSNMNRRLVHRCYLSDCICYRGDAKQRCYPSAIFGCVLELNNEMCINEALRKTITVFYELFRNKPSHAGMRCNVVNSNTTLFTKWDDKTVSLIISFKDLRTIVISGITKYYELIK